MLTNFIYGILWALWYLAWPLLGARLADWTSRRKIDWRWNLGLAFIVANTLAALNRIIEALVQWRIRG